MLIIPSALDALFVGFQAHYEVGVRSAAPMHGDIADVFSMPVAEFNFPIPEGLPCFKNWPKGQERTWRSMNAHNTKLITGDRELSVTIPRDAIRFDQYSVFERQFATAGQNSQLAWDDMVFEAILAGESSVCFDGQPFYDTEHPVTPSDALSAVQSNLHSTKPLTEANLDFGVGAFMAWKGPDGRELGIAPNELHVGPANYINALRLTTAAYNAAGATNIHAGTLTVRVIPGMGLDWTLNSTNKGAKPVALNKAVEASMLTLASPSDSNVINLREYRFAGDLSGAAALTVPALSHKFKAA